MSVETAIAGKHSRPSDQRSLLLGIILALLAGLLIGGAGFTDYLPFLLLFAAGVALILALDPWLSAILLFIATQMTSIKYDVGAITIKPEHLILLTCFVGFALLFASRRIRIHFTILDIPILGLVFTGLASSYLYSPSLAISMQGMLLQLTYMSMYFFTVNVMLERRARLDLFVKIMMITAVLHALYAIVAFVVFMAVGMDIGGVSVIHFEDFPSTRGLLSEPNLLGAFVSIMLALFAAHLVIPRGEGLLSKRFLYFGFIVLSFVSLTSMTRSAWVGVVTILLLLIFYGRKKMDFFNTRTLKIIVPVVTILAIGMLASSLIYSGARETLGNLVSRAENVATVESGTGEVRVRVEQDALGGWKNHPVIGNGVFSARSAATVSGKESYWLFGTLAQNAHDTGSVGTFFMLWIHVVPIAYGFWAAHKARSDVRKASLAGLSLGALVLMITSQVSSFFWGGFPWVYLGVLVALARDTLHPRDDSVTDGSAGAES